MRKIIASLFISLDGVVEAPDQWQFQYFNDEMGKAVQDGFASSDCLLMGATLYREFRGDGHVASLLTDGVGGCEAHVLAAAAGQLPGSLLREYRGWSDEEWAEAAAGQRSRGWLEADGAQTEAGRAARDARERRTDDLATPPWRQLGPDGCARLLELLDQPVRLVVEGGGIPFPNPVGLPAPSA